MQNDLEDLFSRPIKAMEIEQEPQVIETEVVEGIEEEGDEELSALQIKERNERTIFVGNVDIDLEKKHILKHFKPYGKIENVRFRSVPVDKGELPVKAAVILKKFAKEAAGKNAYVVFSTKEEAEKALEANGSVIKVNHLRVDSAIRKAHDYTKTVFIGNLPFNATEEEVRVFFKACGAIDNIRIIRDPQTHIGKGIAYVTFKDMDGFKASLKKTKSLFKDRELRIKKAAPSERVEKKQMKKKGHTQSNAERRLARKEMKGDEMREQDMKAISNVVLEEPDVEDLAHENDIRTNPSILKKRIKKIQRKTGDDKLAITIKETERAKDKAKKELFNGVNERKKRREDLKKKHLANKKQFHRQSLTLKSKKADK